MKWFDGFIEGSKQSCNVDFEEKTDIDNCNRGTL